MNPTRSIALAVLVSLLPVSLTHAAVFLVEKDKAKAHADSSPFKAETFSGLKLRGIGPALTSGRIVDIVVHPKDRATWYLAVASGGIWKTTNAGTTWTSVFDGQGSYSVGCLAIDPANPLTIWAGTGENNSQRSVAYGDGVYRSDDGGKNWQNMGLKTSEHIGRIAIDPRASNIVWVAAQGPLWAGGGDRGLFKTTDGGKNWQNVLKFGEFTGVSDVVFDPRNPDVVYAASYQRHRKVWTLINGGPESALHKSVDGGKTWKKLENGLPKEEMGRIGIAIAPADPDVVYAVIEASNKAGGFFRSVDAGGSWDKMSDYVAGGPQYYQELIPDPKNPDRVYSMDVFMKVTDDAGKTFRNAGEKNKHVDNHALWIDPDDTDHLINGCDGGVYESFDRAATWKYFANLPVTQFYKVTTDNAEPFYNIYGGTQDNFSLGGPSRTRSINGITNADWFVTLGGDGFQSQVDPKDPNIVYSILQYGVIVRHDRKTGEMLDIQPQPEEGEALRWNWDSPLIISPHMHTRLYYAAQRLFRSDDRGNSWRAVSPDLTRQIDRNTLKVMGRIWGVDSVAKNSSTSFYGNIVTLSESPLVEGLLYVGTDDGLIQVSEDGGTTWRRIEKFPGVPEKTYVSRVVASQHDAATVYATFENHKEGDFHPYVLKSRDRGATWTTIASDLPERGSVYVLVEDHVRPELLFVGTEFGLFFTPNTGSKWVQLKGGIPVIQVRDLAIQKREDDLVAATFGRGFYVLDDYSPLREATVELLDREATLLAPRPADLFVPSTPLGVRDKGFQGESYFTAPNPPFGAVFTWYLKEEIKTKKATRQAAEKETAKKGGDVLYPSWDDLRAEDREEEPAIIVTVTDEDGAVVRRLAGPVTAGINRVAWDLRYPPLSPTALKPPSLDNPFFDPPVGPLAAPGTYKVSLAKRVNGVVSPLSEPKSFAVRSLGSGSLPAPDREALLAFQHKTGRLQRAVLGAARAIEEMKDRLSYLKLAILETPGVDQSLGTEARRLEQNLADQVVALTGDSTVGSRNEPTSPAILDRVSQIVGGHWSTTGDATATHRRLYDQAASRFGGVLDAIRSVSTDLKRLEAAVESAGAPWTPGRIPEWRRE